MGVEVKSASGPDACPQGKYALYEHADFNKDNSAGRALIADEAIADLNQGRLQWWADLTTSVVNQTGKTLKLSTDSGGRGQSVMVPPGQALQKLPVPFDNAISSISLVEAPKPAAQGGAQSMLGMARDTGHKMFGGKVEEPGKAQAGSGLLGGARDFVYTAFGGEIERGVKYAIALKSNPQYVLSGTALAGGRAGYLTLQATDRRTIPESAYAWFIDTQTGTITIASTAKDNPPQALTLTLFPAMGHVPMIQPLQTPVGIAQKWKWTGNKLLSSRYEVSDSQRMMGVPSADALALQPSQKFSTYYTLRLALPKNGNPNEEWQLMKAG